MAGGHSAAADPFAGARFVGVAVSAATHLAASAAAAASGARFAVAAVSAAVRSAPGALGVAAASTAVVRGVVPDTIVHGAAEAAATIAAAAGGGGMARAGMAVIGGATGMDLRS